MRGARRSIAIAIAVMASAGVLVGDLGVAPTAQANGWPSSTITQPATVSADALPTVQINGVVWAQVVVGNTVYVGGNFTSARPAGSPAGTNEVPRANFLAYDLSTGALLTSVVLDANAQVRTIEASPDGSRVYVGGDFTTFGGVTRNRVAAISPATNTLVANFAPNVGYHVYDLGVTDSTVYVGGNFTNVGTQVRDRLAAFNVSGALLSWAPSAPDRAVWAVRVSPDGTKVAVAGQFETLNGSTTFGRGFAVVDAVTGATMPFATTSVIRNGGPDGAITSLASDGDLLYGSGYTFGRTAGVLENVFAAEWGDGTLRWLSDCHGDTYSVHPQNGVVYTASHSHYCGNIGGFGQPDVWDFHRGLAFSKEVAGTVATERLGYSNFAGRPRPDLLNFFPTINAGTFTGLTQGPWSVAGNDRYIVYGGEFTTVNGVNQQGLVRFQTRGFASNAQGPQLFNATYPVKVRSFSAGTVTLSWQANRDRDNATLEYRVFRRTAGTTGNGSLRLTRSMTAPFWNRPVMTWTDSGADVVPGTVYEYRVQVTDGYNNFANSVWTSILVPDTGAASEYVSSVLASEPDSFWRLGETAGSTVATDVVGWRDATMPASGVTLGQPGAITGDADTGAQFGGATGTFARTTTSELPPSTLSLEAWFRTPTTANGGLIVGFNQSNTAGSAGSTSAQDRHIYMDTTGRVHFAVNPTTAVTLTSNRDYRDNGWHHVVGTLGAEGMRFYVDGVLIAERSDVQWGRTGYYGFWRIGGGALDGFPSTNNSTSRWFDGTIDDVALYKSVLTADEVTGHYVASGRTPNVPADPYGQAVHGALPSLYWRLGETAPASVAVDSSPQGRNGAYLGGVTLGAAGAVTGTANTAATFNGTNARVSTTVSAAAPQVYSTELWFSTTTATGGKLIGFGDQSGSSNSANYDRHVYMQNDGRLVFGTSVVGTTSATQLNVAQQNRITSSAAYNDGAWHHVVATQSAAGLRLYVDGLLVGSNAASSARSYNGYWRVGGDPTWGASSNYFNGAIDEVAVYPVALDATAVFDRYVTGAGIVPNKPPVAAFGSTVDAGDGRTATLDGSTSADSDGSIVNWAWNFGDGSAPVSGANASVQHTYAATGTFTVTLIVTDDDGATHQVSAPVTTVNGNVLPQAALTASIVGEEVTLDGGGSTDADGTVVTWSWNYGDGSPVASGPSATTTHTYPGAGTYAVTLTVTDDRGGVHQLTRSVSTNDLPAPPAPPVATLASDLFERSVANGFANADIGGAWSLSSNAANYSVASGRATIRMGAPAAGPSAFLGSVAATNVSVVADVTVDKAATGGGTYATLIGRRLGTAGDYRATIRYQANGTIQALLTRRVGTADTTLAVNNAVAGLPAAPGQSITARLEVVGSNPTQLRLKLWPTGTAEPAAWLLAASDSTASHQVAGSVGVASYLSGSATNAPVVATFDNLAVVDPTVVLDAAPTARFSVTTDERTASFDGALTVDDGTIAAWAWDFGDGRTSTAGPTASVAYAAAGTYLVTLTVTDSQGAVDHLALAVSVD